MQLPLNLDCYFRRSAELSGVHDFGQHVFLQAHPGRGCASLKDPVDVLWHVADLGRGHGAILALQAPQWEHRAAVRE